MSRKFRRLALLAKRETTYGTDSVPTGAADAIRALNATITPMAGEEQARELILPHLGHQGVLLSGHYVRLEFEVEVAGAGAAGSVPGYGVLLRGCAMSETVTAGTSVAYQPQSTGEESVSIYWVQDGVRHIAIGSRGTVSMDFEAKKIPRFKFSFMGLMGTITDQALPAVTFTNFRDPLPVSMAATTLSLHGSALVAERVSVDLGNSIEPRHLIGEETIELVDRKATGTIIAEAMLIAQRDWFTIARNRTRGALALQHGVAAGAIVQLAAPAVEIGRPTQGQSQGIINHSLPLMLVPNAGNDELVITVR